MTSEPPLGVDHPSALAVPTSRALHAKGASSRWGGAPALQPRRRLMPNRVSREGPAGSRGLSNNALKLTNAPATVRSWRLGVESPGIAGFETSPGDGRYGAVDVLYGRDAPQHCLRGPDDRRLGPGMLRRVGNSVVP
jgi:hypothetical protein